MFHHKINNLIYFIFFIFSYHVTFLLFLSITNHNNKLHHFCSGHNSIQWLLRKCTFIQLFHYLRYSFMISFLQTIKSFSQSSRYNLSVLYLFYYCFDLTLIFLFYDFIISNLKSFNFYNIQIELITYQVVNNGEVDR